MDVGHDRRHSSASHQGGRLGGARWPARAQRLLEASYTLCVEGLQEPLRRCLSEFEKQLFALAERAHHSGEQQDCFASRQRVLQGRTTFAQRFMERLGNALGEIDRAKPAPAAAGANVKPWQTLELVDPGEQEVSMTLEQLGARGEVRHSSVLYELGHRLAVLIGAPPLEGQALPLGPHALAQACHEAGVELELPLKHQLLLLQHFDQWVIQALAPLYDTINAHLQGDGILPQLRSIPIPRHIGKRARPVAGSPEAASEPAPPAGHAGTAQAGGSGEADRLAALDPCRQRQAHQRRAIDAMDALEARILQGGAGVLQLRPLEQPGALAVAAGVHLALDQLGQTFLEGQAQAVALVLLLLQGVGEALELEGAQLGDGGVVEHGSQRSGFGGGHRGGVRHW